MPKKIYEHLDISQDDRDFVTAHSKPKPSIDHIDGQALAIALAGGPGENVEPSRQGMANSIKKLAMDDKTTPEARARLLDIASKFESSIARSPNIPGGKAPEPTIGPKVHEAVKAAEREHGLAGYPHPGNRKGRNFVSPAEREKYERFLGNRPPAKPAPAPTPEKTEPTTREKIVAVAQKRAERRKIQQSVKPAPRRNVRLHVKKSGLPKLTKGRNVKLQVPSSKLPHTERLRSVLKR